MNQAKSAAQIIKKIGCDKLNLFKGPGYWYFEYDDVDAGVFETASVCCMYLNQMSVDQWVEEGVEFLKRVRAATLNPGMTQT